MHQMFKFCIFATISSILIIGLTFAVAHILYEAEWRQEQKEIEKEREDDYNDNLRRHKAAERFNRIFKTGATFREVKALITEFCGNNYPSARLERPKTRSRLQWTRGSSQWLVVSEALLSRFDRLVPRNSVPSQIAPFFLRVAGAGLIILIIGSMGAFVAFVLQFICSLPFRFNQEPHRLTGKYQSKLVKREALVVAVAVFYFAAVVLVGTLAYSRQRDCEKMEALVTVVFRMVSMYHEEYANDGEKVPITTRLAVFLCALNLLLTSAYCFLIYAFLALYRTWMNSDYFIMESSEYRRLLDQEQHARTNHLQYYKKQQ